MLGAADVKAYKDALRQARSGVLPARSKVSNPVLWGHVEAAYLLRAKGVRAAQLNDWLQEYRDLGVAGEVYRLAEEKRAKPRQQCKTKTVLQKIPAKGKKKARTKKVKTRSCTMVGSWGPAPLVPLAVERLQEKRDARERLRTQELNGLSRSGRQILGASWQRRSRGDYAGALAVLLAPGARAEMGSSNWQTELVKLADYYHGQRQWAKMLQAAEPASTVRGPDRDEARWLAGYGFFRLGKLEEAAAQWQKLVHEEPVGGKHAARGAWWGARTLVQLRQHEAAQDLLRRGAKDALSFYGQLCAAKLGQPLRLAWNERIGGPSQTLTRVPGVQRGLALAQLGEVELAQRELRAADSEIPYQATRDLAAAAVELGLPAAALQAGKNLLERGEVVPAALYPLPERWQPTGGWQFDRALVLGIMRQESAFQPQIGSRVGAQGLMQIMPSTGAYIARMTGRSYAGKRDLHDPATNLAMAQDYLSYLSSKLDGNLLLVVAAYNGGIGNVQRWLDRGVTPGHDPVLWLEAIPFDETRDYVEKVFANYWLYQQRLGHRAWSLQALADGYWPLHWGDKADRARGTAGLPG